MKRPKTINLGKTGNLPQYHSSLRREIEVPYGKMDAAIELIGLLPFVVQERLSAKDGMMRQAAAPKHDGIRPGKTVFANVDRLGGLAVRGEIDAVRDEL